MAYYTSKFKLNNAKTISRKDALAKDRANKWAALRTPKAKRKLGLRQRLGKFKKVFTLIFGVFVIVLMIGALFAFGYLQSLTENLPSPDKPFGDKSSASEIYDRNGKLLYRVYGNENRDLVSINDVPPLMKWSLLAAEDIDFYNHTGVDLIAVTRCGIQNLAGTSACGGSTITQQLIKQTALTNERSWERKIKEVVLAMQIEQQRTKDEILEMYMNVIPEGSNIYGLKSAAKEYFNRDLSELNLAEFAILASIPQDPNNMSPTKSTNANSKEKVKSRQMYVLGQMEKYFDLINARIKEDTGTENALTREMIEEAKSFELVYSTVKRREELKAPHFVFYVQKLLQQRNYNNGEPFTKENLETSGLKIFTTLDLDMQEIAEEQVKEAVDVYGKKYGGENAALVALNPNNGEVLSMVGSYDYFGTSSPEGCIGSNCKFNPEVNVIDTLQSYGSSMKPMVYYYAMERGLIHAGSLLPDIPIKIGNYQPKNFGNVFTGIRPARIQLADSQNIPPIYMLDELGVDNFVAEMQKWGYSTLNDPRGYGPSIAVGGAEIKLIDHAQAYGVLATGGKLIKHEVVLKIEDRDGNIIFEYQPVAEQVADPRGTFIVSDILNANRGGPGLNASNGGAEYRGWDKRDIAGKTGTSEDGKETLFATYTPELVTIGWLGNNNNEPMSTSVSGFGSARPWIAKYMMRVGSYYPPTPFNRPAGVVGKGACDGQGDDCAGIGGDLGIIDINPPAYVKVSPYTVCTDQLDHLARTIDIDLGFASTINVKSYILPNKKLQSFLDKYISGKPDLGGVIPTEYCTINRNPSGTIDPWAVIVSPTSGMVISDANLPVQYNAYTALAGATITKTEVYIDGNGPIANSTTLPYSNIFSLSGAQASSGNHTLTIKVYDSTGAVGSTVVGYTIPGPSLSVSITSPGGNTLVHGSNGTINYSFSGSSPDSISLLINGVSTGSCSAGATGSCTFTAGASGSIEVEVKVKKSGTDYLSNKLTLTIT